MSLSFARVLPSSSPLSYLFRVLIAHQNVQVMSPNQYCSLLQMHQITSLASHVSLLWTHIGPNLCIFYLSAILVSNACDVATNPGPPKFPCNICKKAVRWTTPGVCCDTCDQWFHKACMGMNSCIYESLASNNVSRQCCRCGMPNFSSSFFDSTISEHTNPFSILSPSSSSIADSRIGEPIAMSSPVANTRTSNPKRLQIHKLTVIVTNCRSLVNKKAELINLLDSTKADIAICTETWLNSTISDSEICPDNYSLFRNDRTDRHGGGVAILTSNKFIASQPVEYMCNNSELQWVEIQLVGCKKLMIGSK